MSRIGIVVGMKAEAACVSFACAGLTAAGRPLVAIAAADPKRARAEAKRLVIHGADALLSFGVAGGLVADGNIGDVVLASAVVLPSGERRATDHTWLKHLSGVLQSRKSVLIGDIAGQDYPTTSVNEKAALRLRTEAVAVDMESHGVALAAEETGVPFMAVRVILDAAEQAIPRSALAGLGPDGESRVLPVLAALALRPWELGALLALGKANKRALAVLRHLAKELAPNFALGA